MTVDGRNNPQFCTGHHRDLDLIVFGRKVEVRSRREDNGWTGDGRKRSTPVTAEFRMITYVCELPCLEHSKQVVRIVPGKETMEKFQKLRFPKLCLA